MVLSAGAEDNSEKLLENITSFYPRKDPHMFFNLDEAEAEIFRFKISPILANHLNNKIKPNIKMFICTFIAIRKNNRIPSDSSLIDKK